MMGECSLIFISEFNCSCISQEGIEVLLIHRNWSVSAVNCACFVNAACNITVLQYKGPTLSLLVTVMCVNRFS